jgi:hypothetical protein
MTGKPAHETQAFDAFDAFSALFWENISLA